MSGKVYELAFALGAKIHSSFGQAFQGANKHLGALNSSIAGLQKHQKSITAFSKLQGTIKKTAGDLETATANMRRLKDEVRSSFNPSKKMLADLEAATNKRKALKRSLVNHRAALGQLNQQMRTSGINTARMASENERLARSFDKVKSRQKALAAAMTAQSANKAQMGAHGSNLRSALGVGAALAAPLVMAANPAIGFESAMADVRKVVNFDTPTGFADLSKLIKSMPRNERMPLTQSELATIAAAGGQLGVQAKQLPVFIRIVGKMSTAFGMSADEAGDAAAKLSNVYNIPINEITALGDAVNHLSDNTAAKAPQMIETLMRVGGTAKQFGLSATNTAALANVFIALGKTPEIASTAINAMLNKLMTADKQTAKFQEAIAGLGMDASSLKESIGRDAQGALTGFLKEVSKLEKSDRAGVLFDLFGMEYSDDISLLVGSLEKYEQALDLVGKKTNYAGSMQKEFDVRASVSRNNLKILMGTVTELGINIGTVMLPAINSGAAALGKLAGHAADFATAHPNIVKVVVGITALGVGAAATAATVAGAGYAITFLNGGLLAARTAFIALAIGQKASAVATGIMTAAQWVLNAAMTANPIGLIVAGVSALIAGLVAMYKYWGKIRSYLPAWLGGSESAEPLPAIDKDFSKLQGGIRAATAESNSKTNVNFSPVINVPPGANAAEVRSQVDAALATSRQSFETDVARLAFA